MENYLIIRDPATLKPKRLNASHSSIEPLEFCCYYNLDKGNELTLKMPFNYSDELNIGDWVECPSDDGNVYGGIVLGKSIDKQKGIVTYSGLSARGCLNGVAIPTAGNYTGYPVLVPLEFYDLNGSKSSEYMSGTVNHNIWRYLDACNSYFWDIPCTFNEGTANYIPYSVFQQKGEDHGSYYQFSIINALHKGQYTNYTPYSLLTKYYEMTGQKFKISTPTASYRFFDVDISPSVNHKYLITDEEVIYTQGFPAANVYLWAGSSTNTKVCYVDNNDAIVMRSGFSAFPIRDGKFNGFTQFYNVYYNTKDDGTVYPEEEREAYIKQQLLAGTNSSPLQTQIKIDSQKLSADVGDTVTLIDEDLEVTSNQVVENNTTA